MRIMLLSRLLVPLLWAVTTNGLNQCILDDGCASGTTSLDFESCDMTDDDVRDLVECFDGVGRGNIESLHLGKNDIATLPVDLFDGFEAIANLSIANNEITEILDGTFKEATTLLSLHIQANDMATLPSGVFDGLTSLRNLDMSRCFFDTLPDDVFDDLTSLTDLNIWTGDMHTLPVNLFGNLSSLLNLNLGRGDLRSLPAGVFNGLTSLLELNLEQNDLTTLPDDLFRDLPSLLVLELQHNYLVTLPDDIFGGLTSLLELDLSGNRITTLPADAFTGLTSLLYLHLGFMDVTTLPDGIFADLKSLTDLYLPGNDLATVPAYLFDDLQTLELLNLQLSAFQTLPADLFGSLINLKELDLSYGELTTLPADIFDTLPSLRVLTLFSNALSTLPAGLFDGLQSLESLNLHSNDNLQCLPSTVAGYVQLPDTFDDTTTCACPDDPTCDEDGAICECQAGIQGYSCVGTSSEVIRATVCPSSGVLRSLNASRNFSVDCSSDGDCEDDKVCCPATQTCEFLLGRSSSACGDPHMTGFRGQTFDFTGEDGEWYALISDLPSLHLNMRVTTPVPGLPEITYITGISLITVDADGIAHSIVISANNPHSLDSSCPSGMSTCLADGALSIAVDGDIILAAPGTATPGSGVEISAVNLPGACRSFGFEKYWERKMLEQVRLGEAIHFESQNVADLIDNDPSVSAAPNMGEWILGDPTATDMMECSAYVAKSSHADGGLFAHQSEHASFKVTTPNATVRVSHGKLHQVAMRDPTSQYDLPDHLTWQMNLAIDHKDISRYASGILGETFVPTVDTSGDAIMHGMEAIRGTQESYRVAGPLDVEFAGYMHRV